MTNRSVQPGNSSTCSGSRISRRSKCSCPLLWQGVRVRHRPGSQGGSSCPVQLTIRCASPATILPGWDHTGERDRLVGKPAVRVTRRRFRVFLRKRRAHHGREMGGMIGDKQRGLGDRIDLSAIARRTDYPTHVAPGSRVKTGSRSVSLFERRQQRTLPVPSIPSMVTKTASPPYPFGALRPCGGRSR